MRYDQRAIGACFFKQLWGAVGRKDRKGGRQRIGNCCAP